jgi:hypothetical protein
MEAPPCHRACGTCGQVKEKFFRCSNCFYQKMLCQNCCIKDHSRHPFHHIEEWTGSFFTPTTLRNLGFILHIGHNSDCCEAASDDDPSEDTVLVIVDRGGVFRHTTRWCACKDHPAKHIQPFQMGLYSASIHKPGTAFTFQLLQYFHLDAMECRTSASNFFNKLRRLTNDTFPDTVPVSYLIFQSLFHKVELLVSY